MTLRQTAKSSILVFELNRKFLLYKILTKELAEHLQKEFIKYFDTQKIQEEQTDLKSSLNQDQAEKSKDTYLRHDLIYEYFAPIVNSFEISKEINFLFEHALFKDTNFLVRFFAYKNCLLLLVYDSNLSSTNLEKINSALTKQVNAEFYLNWCCKSFISLVKFKFGICSDEKCFETDDTKYDLKNLYLKWSSYFLIDQIYFIEAIEQLHVNDDIKIKCQLFLNEFTEFLYKTESIMSEFEYMDESFNSLGNNDEDFQFLNENEEQNSQENPECNFKITEIEDFFNDLSQINMHILSYSGKSNPV